MDFFKLSVDEQFSSRHRFQTDSFSLLGQETLIKYFFNKVGKLSADELSLSVEKPVYTRGFVAPTLSEHESHNRVLDLRHCNYFYFVSMPYHHVTDSHAGFSESGPLYVFARKVYLSDYSKPFNMTKVFKSLRNETVTSGA